MKRYTEKKAAAVCRRIFANSATATRYNASGKRIQKPINGWYTEDGYIMTDGFRAIRLNECPREGVPCLLSAHLLTPEEREKENKMRATVQNIINEVFTLVSSECTGPLEDFRVKAGTVQTEKQIYYRISGENSPAYNPRYLIDMIQAFPDALYFIDKRKGQLSPLWAISEHGAGVVLPVRVM